MFKVAFIVGNQFEADLAINLLKSIGLHPLELQTARHVSLAGADQNYRVEVPERELQIACEALLEAGYVSHCLHCGYSLRGLERNAGCPECGWNRERPAVERGEQE